MRTHEEPMPKTEVTEEVNYFAVHFRDAEVCLQSARATGLGLREIASLSRASILNFHLALEALQNRIYKQFIDPHLAGLSREPLTRLSYAARWDIAPLLAAAGSTERTNRLKVDREPWQTVIELAEIRNWMVHRKPESLEVTIGGRIFAGEGHAAPTPKNAVWPHTKVPRHPDLLSPSHVDRIKSGVESFVLELTRVVPDLTTEWIWATRQTVKKIMGLRRGEWVKNGVEDAKTRSGSGPKS
jgi:hypothetical protein